MISRRRMRSIFVALSLAASACQHDALNAPTTAASDQVTLPGVDTHDFTPREAREFSRYVTDLPAPCPAVAAPIGQCILEKRDCAECLPAATMIAKAVHDGLAPEQVQDLYKARFAASTVKPVPVDGSPSRGPVDAAVVLVEFADFECPFCQRLAPELDAAWEKRKNAVRFVYKFMPLAMHPHGEIAARAGIAAEAQGKFWEMSHRLFASGDRLDQTNLEGYAKAIGLDVDRFRTDMQSAAATTRIEADRKLADALGVKGTPTLYVDGREYDMKLDIGDWLDSEIAARGSAAASKSVGSPEGR